MIGHMMDLFFGGRRLVFESPLTLEDATKRLQNEIAAPKWRVYENRRQSFIGTFADGRFQAIRLVGGKNSFRPMIDGRLSASANGCRVDVRLKMPAVAVVACVLFVTVGVTIMSVALSRAAATGNPLARYFALLGSLMFGMPLVLPTVEARKAARILATIFQSEPVR
jgi:hypothetical protein